MQLNDKKIVWEQIKNDQINRDKISQVLINIISQYGTPEEQLEFILSIPVLKQIYDLGRKSILDKLENNKIYDI